MHVATRRWLVTGLILAGVLGWRLAGALAADGAPGAAALPNPFFAYCVGIGTGKDTATLPAQLQLVPMLEELGYSGMAYVGLNGAPEMIDALEKHHQKLLAAYSNLNVDPGDRGYDPQLKQIIPKLQGHGTLVWLTITSRRYKPSTTEGDDRAVELLREIADVAQKSGVSISLYPHVGNYMERMEDAVRLAKKADRPNVGVTFTFCHFLAADKIENLDRVLAMARPYLNMVTINGTSGGERNNMARWIQVLGDGTFDVGVVLRALRKLDYRGPIGVIAYGIKGDRREILARSMRAWKRLSAEPAADPAGSPAK